ncbi:MAG TPA: VOC family protein, partial [Agromyces sp.]|nr:VOC family protein [Agromyces sp.]
LLRWRVTVRDDGRTECSGALPSLIEWHGTHPSEHLPPSEVEIRDVVLRGVPEAALEVLRLPAVIVEERDEAHPQPLSATFDTSHGRIVLDGWVPPTGA